MHVGQRTSPPPPAPPSRGMGCSHGLSPMWPAVLGAVAVDGSPGRTTQATRRRAMLAMDANQRTLPLIWALYEYPRALLASFCVQPAPVKALPQKSTSTEHTHP